MNTTQLAQAFIAGHQTARAGNALLTVRQPPGQDFRTVEYRLHGHVIAEAYTDGLGRVRVIGQWCGYYTQTAQRHLRAIIGACRSAGLDLLGPAPSAREAKAAADRSGVCGPFVIT